MGSKHLDAHTVAVIRRRHAEGEKLAHLAEHYSIGVSTVRRIVRRETYTAVLDSAADRDALDLPTRQPKVGPLTRRLAQTGRLGQLRSTR